MVDATVVVVVVACGSVVVVCVDVAVVELVVDVVTAPDGIALASVESTLSPPASGAPV